MPLLTKDQRGGKALLAKLPAAAKQECASCTEPRHEQPKVTKYDTACPLRGEQIGTTPCETGCKSRMKVYACPVLGECTLSERVLSKQFCGTCTSKPDPGNEQASA